MTKHTLYHHHPKIVRDSLNSAIDLADEILEKESLLIHKLHQIDQDRFYVRYGYKSLSGFCRSGLQFSKTQTQRLVTQVRRKEFLTSDAKTEL